MFCCNGLFVCLCMLIFMISLTMVCIVSLSQCFLFLPFLYLFVRLFFVLCVFLCLFDYLCFLILMNHRPSFTLWGQVSHLKCTQTRLQHQHHPASPKAMKLVCLDFVQIVIPDQIVILYVNCLHIYFWIILSQIVLTGQYFCNLSYWITSFFANCRTISLFFVKLFLKFIVSIYDPKFECNLICM